VRICLVSAAYRPYPSGVGEHVHHLGLELGRRGHDSHILTTNYPNQTDDELPVTRLGKALILPSNRSRFTLPVGRNLAGQVRRFFHHNRFDVVHCHGLFPPDISYWALRYSSAPVVVTFHTVRRQLPGLVRSGFRTIFRRTIARIAAKIAVSQAARDWSEPWLPGPYHIIPNGVDTTRFRPDVPAAECLRDGRPTILFVGRLDIRKGLPVLVRAMGQVLTAYPSARLVIVGSGPQRPSIQRLCTSLGIEPSVRFMGRVSHQDLPGYYSGCTIFVAPALSGEAMGIVLIEALASGRPVVASDIPGYNEVITNGRDGILVPANNPAALAQALIQLLDSPALRERLGQLARARAADYAWPLVAERIERVYQAVVS